MATLNRTQVEDALANMQSLGQTQITVDGKGRQMTLDPSLPVEYQTDKQSVKIVPCRDCTRPLVVTTFFAPEKAVCRSCKGEAVDAGVATVAQPVPGQTDPRKAKDMTKTLVNPHFALARCPVHPDDDEHRMELVSVVHSPHYGPTQLIGYSAGRPEYRQIAPGEVAMHQCQHPECLATVTYDTTRQTRLRAMNEPKIKPDFGRAPDEHLAELQGTREDRRGAVAPMEAA